MFTEFRTLPEKSTLEIWLISMSTPIAQPQFLGNLSASDYLPPALWREGLNCHTKQVIGQLQHNVHDTYGFNAFTAVKLISRLPCACLVANDLAVVERCHPAFDLIFDAVIRALELFSDHVDIPAVFQFNLNKISFFKCKVLTFSCFCGIISVAHSAILSVFFW